MRPRCEGAAAAAPLGILLMLAGCSALLGGGKPVQLYRFDAPPLAPSAAGNIVAPRYTLLVMPVRFAAEIQGDRVLASRNKETLYIKGLRWVAPAPTLYEQLVRASFRARAPWFALTDRRGGGPADHILQIRMDRFEARYDAGIKELPTIHIEGEAVLLDSGMRSRVGSYRIQAQQQARGRDAAAIVAAFDQVAATSIAATVDWTTVAITAH